MGINCMFQCLTLILSQSPLGQVSSWRICVCYSKHNLKGNDFSYKRESDRLNINALFIVREWAASKKKKKVVYVMKDKLSWNISDKIRGGRNQHGLFSLSESGLPVNKGTHCFCLENCILLQRKTVYFTKGKIALLLSILNDTAPGQQLTLLDNLPDLSLLK